MNQQELDTCSCDETDRQDTASPVGRDGGLGDQSLPDLVPLLLSPENHPVPLQRKALPRALNPPHHVAQRQQVQGEGTRGHAQLKSDLSSTSNGSLGGAMALGRLVGLTEGLPVEMETTWLYEREQFIGRRRLEEKEAVLIARPGSHSSRA